MTVLTSDDALRAMLALTSDDGHTPRDTTFFFLGGNVTRLAAAATLAGYKATITDDPAGVVLDITIAVDKTSFTPHGERMRAWADEFGCDYDGWHCTFTPSDPLFAGKEGMRRVAEVWKSLSAAEQKEPM